VRERVFIATKFGNTWGPNGQRTGISGKPDYVRSACDASLKRLGVDVIDLYYQHRVGPDTPIEDTVLPGPVRGFDRDHPHCARSPSDHCAAVRVLAVVAPSRDGRSPVGAGTRDRLRALQSARVRLPDRADQVGR